MSTDPAQTPGDADPRAAWRRMQSDARRRLHEVFKTGGRSMNAVEAVAGAQPNRALWLEGGTFHRIYADSPKDIERGLAEHPELTQQHVADALLLLDDAVADARILGDVVRWIARDMGLPERQVSAAEAVEGLSSLARRRREVDDDERRLIRAARAAGLGWGEIGAALGYAASSAKQTAYRRAVNLGLDDLKKGAGNAGDE